MSRRVVFHVFVLTDAPIDGESGHDAGTYADERVALRHALHHNFVFSRAAFAGDSAPQDDMEQFDFGEFELPAYADVVLNDRASLGELRRVQADVETGLRHRAHIASAGVDAERADGATLSPEGASGANYLRVNQRLVDFAVNF